MFNNHNKVFRFYYIIPYIIVFLLIILSLINASPISINKKIANTEFKKEDDYWLYQIALDVHDIHKYRNLLFDEDGDNAIKLRNIRSKIQWYSTDARLNKSYVDNYGNNSYKNYYSKNTAKEFLNSGDSKYDVLNSHSIFLLDCHKLNHLQKLKRSNYVNLCNFQVFINVFIVLFVISIVFVLYKQELVINYLRNNNNVYIISQWSFSEIRHNLMYKLVSYCLSNIINKYVFLIIPVVISVMSGIFGFTKNPITFSILTYYVVPILSFIQFVRIYHKYIRGIYNCKELDVIISNFSIE